MKQCWKENGKCEQKMERDKPSDSRYKNQLSSNQNWRQLQKLGSESSGKLWKAMELTEHWKNLHSKTFPNSKNRKSEAIIIRGKVGKWNGQENWGGGMKKKCEALVVAENQARGHYKKHEATVAVHHEKQLQKESETKVAVNQKRQKKQRAGNKEGMKSVICPRKNEVLDTWPGHKQNVLKWIRQNIYWKSFTHRSKRTFCFFIIKNAI